MLIMRKAKNIDFAKLLGFGLVSDEIAGSADFRDEAIDAKLGAKVGFESLVACDLNSEFPDE